MLETKCYYHPEKYAVTTCVTCKKDICRDDRKISTSRYGSKEYCVICYASYLESSVTTLIVVGTIFLIILAGFFFIIYQSSVAQNPSKSFVTESIIVVTSFYLGFVALFVIMILYNHSKASTATKNASEFQQSLNLTKKNIQENRTAKCPNCASLLIPEDEFCSNCGMEVKKSM